MTTHSCILAWRIPWTEERGRLQSMGSWRAVAAAAKSLQSSNSLRPHRRQPTRLPRPWDSPGKNTGVGCHFLLQCMNVKSESEVTRSCRTPSNPMDCSPPGSSVHGIFQARLLEWGAIAFYDTGRLTWVYINFSCWIRYLVYFLPWQLLLENLIPIRKVFLLAIVPLFCKT